MKHLNKFNEAKEDKAAEIEADFEKAYKNYRRRAPTNRRRH
mgnify:CR=1 FL=1